MAITIEKDDLIFFGLVGFIIYMFLTEGRIEGPKGGGCTNCGMARARGRRKLVDEAPDISSKLFSGSTYSTKRFIDC